MLTMAPPQLPVHFMEAVLAVPAVLLAPDMPPPPQALTRSAKQHPATIASPRVIGRVDREN